MWDTFTSINSLEVWANSVGENEDSQILIESIILFLFALNFKANKKNMTWHCKYKSICSRDTETLHLGNLVTNIYKWSFQRVQGSCIYISHSGAGQRRNAGSKKTSGGIKETKDGVDRVLKGES